jgi:peroxiredoxin
MQQSVTCTLESRLAAVREAAERELPRLAALNQRLFADLTDTVLPGVVAVGDQAPETDLPAAATGRPARLSWVLDDGPAVIAFYRGRWCPYSNLHIHALSEVYGAVRELGAEVLFVGPDTLSNARRISEQWGGRVPVLADLRGEAMKRYGVAYSIPDYLRPGFEPLGFPMLNPETGWHLPVTATFIVDRLGVVRASHVDSDYTRRMEPADILEQLRLITSR